MKVLGIVSSPRQNGNVDTLVQEVLDGAAQAGHRVDKVNINDMDYSGCQACMWCKKNGSCKLDDDIARLMESIKDADAVVFGSPIYYWQFNSQFRTFIDRLYMFLSTDFKVSLAPHKKAVVITSQGNPDATMYEPVFSDFDKILQMYGFDKAGEAHMVGGNMPSAVKQREDLLQKARSIGKAL